MIMLKPPKQKITKREKLNGSISEREYKEKRKKYRELIRDNK